jgi:uncharacterized damage-inducible protein DinB
MLIYFHLSCIAMSLEKFIRQTISTGMRGGNTHMDPFQVIEGLSDDDVNRSPAEGVMTIWEQATHLQFWQEILMQNIKEGKPNWRDIDFENAYPPDYKTQYGGWTGFSQAVKDTVSQMQDLAQNCDLTRVYPDISNTSAIHLLRIACSHLSYHIAQIALTRKILGLWPPPPSEEKLHSLI